jgi:LysM repeat protein
MRRTTIYRSERAALLALVAGLLVGVVTPQLAAQDTTKARVDTVKAARDTVQAPAPAAPLTPAAATPAAPTPTGPAPFVPGAAQQGQLPASHTVVTGETLWSIAQLYFSDPLLWPEIYRLNTGVIEDPHWIYPGEVLNLGSGAPVAVAQAPVDTTTRVTQPPTQPLGADTVRVQPQADTVTALAPPPPDTARVADTAQAVVEAPPPPPSPTEAYQTIFERRRTTGEEVRAVLRAYANPLYRPVRRGEFYSAGFLTENERLPWGRVIGNTATPAIPRLTEGSRATTFDQIAVQPPRSASYHVGDSLLIVRIDRDINGWGSVVVPLGVARVTELQRRQVLADVIMQFSRIHDGHLVLPLEPFKDPGLVRPTPVERGLEGQVVAARDFHEVQTPQQILFINRGRVEGVTPGDVFEVFKPASGLPGSASEEVLMVIEIVHTRDRSASGLVINIIHPGVRPGMPVRLVRKMPS